MRYLCPAMPLAARFSLLRYPLIVLVVFIHADNRELALQGPHDLLEPQGTFSLWLRLFVSQGVARIAVPLFFAISGYLFFLGFGGAWPELKRKWRSRAQSLLIPYISWNLLAMGVLVTVSRGLPFPDWGRNLDLAFGITRPNLIFHLWFVRDLVVLVALAPLAWWLLQCQGGPLFNWLERLAPALPQGSDCGAYVLYVIPAPPSGPGCISGSSPGLQRCGLSWQADARPLTSTLPRRCRPTSRRQARVGAPCRPGSA